MLIFKKEKWLLDMSKNWKNVDDVRFDLYFYNGWVASADGKSRDELVKNGYSIYYEWCEEE